jgi:hypothetical protein
MPAVDNRLGPGTLTLGTPGVDHSFQVSAIALTPSVDSVDGTPTLAVPDPAPETNTSYSLDGSAIQDYAAAAGLQRYCYDNDGDLIDFIWVTNTGVGAGATLTGKCVVRAFTMGGAVAEQVTTDFSWPCEGKPVWSAGTTTAREGEKAAAK